MTNPLKNDPNVNTPELIGQIGYRPDGERVEIVFDLTSKVPGVERQGIRLLIANEPVVKNGRIGRISQWQRMKLYLGTAKMSDLTDEERETYKELWEDPPWVRLDAAAVVTYNQEDVRTALVDDNGQAMRTLDPTLTDTHPLLRFAPSDLKDEITRGRMHVLEVGREAPRPTSPQKSSRFCLFAIELLINAWFNPGSPSTNSSNRGSSKADLVQAIFDPANPQEPIGFLVIYRPSGNAAVARPNTFRQIGVDETHGWTIALSRLAAYQVIMTYMDVIRRRLIPNMPCYKPPKQPDLVDSTHSGERRRSRRSRRSHRQKHDAEPKPEGPPLLKLVVNAK